VLMLCAAVISTPVAMFIGTWSALHRDRLVDHGTSLATLILAALPEFVVGIALVIVFSTGVFRMLPAVFVPAGTGPVWADPKQLILPTLTLVLAVGPYIARMMRATMLEVLESDYVRQARLKGLPERTVLLRHALPNAVGPVVQVVALQLAWLAGGVVVVEFLFRYPGVGFALVDAVANRDLPVIQALALLIAGLYIAVNLLADLVSLATNPKVRTAAR
ncbi:MAG TPA: ABC transporter permease, partial [Pilimelia sp.]|nr:ABC transporter permease [Pilimelia sp.]